jgi:hypothetical protein
MGDSVMEISRAEQSIIKYNLEQYRLEQIRLQDKRDNDYRKVVEKRRFDQIVAERVRRNLRLDLDKGRNIDVEC